MNQQPVEKQLNSDKLEVHSIFRTIQGEGPYSGTAAVFIRLAGCNIQCPLCDTDYTSTRKSMHPGEIVQKVRDKQTKGLVVVTGGEPFRQDLRVLFDQLKLWGYYVQVESNGTLNPREYAYNKNIPERKGVYIVVSPKTPKIHPEMEKSMCALKYVISAKSVNLADGLPLQALLHPAEPQVYRPHENLPIFIQPADEPSMANFDKNCAAVVDSAMRFNYTAQVQIHKFFDLL